MTGPPTDVHRVQWVEDAYQGTAGWRCSDCREEWPPGADAFALSRTPCPGRNDPQPTEETP